MCGQAYLTSARIAEAVGPCPGYPENEEPFLDVIRMHWNAVSAVDSKRVPPAMFKAAEECWRNAYDVGASTGFRNAQVTVIAPTGTIGFMMDCDTTGIEPDLALVKYKKLVGGGVIKIVNNTVPQALIKLGYTPEQIEEIVTHIDSTGTIEGAPASQGRAPAGLRLQLPPAERHALHPLHGPCPNDGRGAAVHLRRDFEDHQHARGVDGGRHHGRLHRELAAGPEGGGDLSRQFEARAAAELRHRQGREESSRPGGHCAAASHREDRLPAGAAQAAGRAAIPSRTSSRSAATKATSRWGCTKTARPAKSSSPWRRKARPSPA